MKPDKALILAAGLGTRMMPLTEDRPKALVEVGGVALIDHMINRLKAVGVKQYIVNVHYFADRLEAHLRQRTDVDIIISDERDQLLETGGGLKKARPLLGEAAIWVANIDSLWQEPEGLDGQALESLAKLWDERRMKAALLLAVREGSIGFEGSGDFFMSPDGILSFRNQAPSAPYAYMGVHITKASIIDNEADAAFSLARVWRQLAPQGLIYGQVMDGAWMHVGDPKARLEAERALSHGQ